MSKSDIRYVVGVRKAKHLRRHVLESAKFTIDVLKEKQVLFEVRKQQSQKVTELRKTITELHKLFGTLKGYIPKKDTPASLKSVRKHQPKQEPTSASQPKQPAPDPSESDLHEVKGLGPTRVKKLHDVGIYSIQDLAKTKPSQLNKAGMSRAVAEKIITRSQQALPSTAKDNALSEMDILEKKLSAIESKLNNL